MKKNLHPKYYDKANVRCGCGHSFTVGSTKEQIEVEICGNCHPFYTGKEKLIDTAGKVERFKARRAKAAAMPKPKPKAKKAPKVKKGKKAKK